MSNGESVWIHNDALEPIREDKRDDETVSEYLKRTQGEPEATTGKEWTEDEIKDLAEERFFELQRSM